MCLKSDKFKQTCNNCYWKEFINSKYLQGKRETKKKKLEDYNKLSSEKSKI